MKTIKDLWEKFIELTKTPDFLWGFPTLALTLVVIFPGRILALILLAIWTVSVIANSDEKG